VTSAAPLRTLEVRHLQLARAFFAALAAVMITFSPDHSAAVGLAVFSGFAIATGLMWFAAVWLIFPKGDRWAAVLLGILALLAGMATGMPGLRTDTMYFVVVIAWSVLSGIVELVAGIRARRMTHLPRSQSRDAITIGALGILLGLGLLAVPVQYALTYTIEEAGQTFTLTGITIAVGIFGGYAAIVAVYLGIAAFSPRPTDAEATAPVTEATAERKP
jgi:hypothetical protein